jgi:hypothetical protein
MLRLPTFAVLTLVLAAVPACARQGEGRVAQPGASPAPASTTPNLVPEGYTGRYRVTAAVLEGGGHGPQLCAAMAQSRPPQCGGIDIAGWSWGGLAHDSERGSSWGSYSLTGRYDGTVFTITEPAGPPDPEDPGAFPSPDFTTPCTPPPGGWTPLDRAKTTDAAITAAITRASAAPDYAGAWVDHHGGPGMPDNDPATTVLNVLFTGDLAAHEEALRKVWGGSLCVQKAARGEAELNRIQKELRTEPGVYTVSTDTVTNSVQLGVYVADVALERRLTQRYGPGVVRLGGLFVPID